MAAEIFITYAGPDAAHATALGEALAALGHAAFVDTTALLPGDPWDTAILAALGEAKLIAVLLSPSWKKGDPWYAHDEVVRAIARARIEPDGVRVVPVVMGRVAPLDMPSGLARLVTLAHPPDEWHATAAALSALAKGAWTGGRAPGDPTDSGPRLSIARLPTPGPYFVGRESERAALDAAWVDPGVYVQSVIGVGGEGKSALTSRWLRALAQRDYGGAARVYGWSFYSQGAGLDRQVSADQFMHALLAWLGDANPSDGDPWARGARLAALIRRQKTLLVLDGLEPLQYPPGEMTGRLKDPALATLLKELAARMDGLCLVTSRLPLADLPPGEGVRAHRLQPLAPADGAAVLGLRGVTGAADELERASAEVKGHALAINLMGGYLAMYEGGDVRRRDRIPSLRDAEDGGGHARRVMEAYARWLDPADVQVLRLVGLFDRGAEPAAVAALLKPPAIPGLTDGLEGPESRPWLNAVAHLRSAGLLLGGRPPSPLDEPASHLEPDRGGPTQAREGPVEAGQRRAGATEPGNRHADLVDAPLDAHPLVREHFGEQLRAAAPAAWQAAHGRLYAHFAGAAPELPDDLPGLEPLYRAVLHGCAAGRHQAALDAVFFRRIRRGNEGYSAHKLGAFAADLAALAHLFEAPWSRPHPALRPADQAWALNEAAFALRALGRLAEAVAPLEATVDRYVEQQDWRRAAMVAGNLSELLLTTGRLDPAPAAPAPGAPPPAPAGAIDRARQAVDFADRSGDAFQRMYQRTALADALHQRGRRAAARALFAEAERLQAEWQPELPRLYGLQGYRYGDLLLPADPAEARRRAEEWLRRRWNSHTLLDYALDHLLLGRAALALAPDPGHPDFGLARRHLDDAVTGLRRAGTVYEQPRGLLARAALYRRADEWPAAERDLAEAHQIAARGGMRLHLADVHLESARLALARGDHPAARAAYTAARDVIRAIAYHRRDPELAELAAALGLTPPPWLGQADIMVELPPPPRPAPRRGPGRALALAALAGVIAWLLW